MLLCTTTFPYLSPITGRTIAQTFLCPGPKRNARRIWAENNRPSVRGWWLHMEIPGQGSYLALGLWGDETHPPASKSSNNSKMGTLLRDSRMNLTAPNLRRTNIRQPHIKHSLTVRVFLISEPKNNSPEEQKGESPMPTVTASGLSCTKNIAAYKKAIAEGKSEAEALKSATTESESRGDDTARDDVPMCACPLKIGLPNGAAARKLAGRKCCHL